jgi:hypothetical protein
MAYPFARVTAQRINKFSASKTVILKAPYTVDSSTFTRNSTLTGAKTRLVFAPVLQNAPHFAVFKENF